MQFDYAIWNTIYCDLAERRADIQQRIAANAQSRDERFVVTDEDRAFLRRTSLMWGRLQAHYYRSLEATRGPAWV